MRLCLLLLLVPSLQACNPGELTFGNTNCYHYVPPTASFDAAVDFCGYIGTGYALTSIPNAFTNNFIWQGAKNQSGLSANYWIGYSYDGSKWSWIDGTTGNYTNWAPNEPNLGSGIVRAAQRNSDGKWVALDPKIAMSFVCASNTVGTTTKRPPHGNSCPSQFKYDPITEYCWGYAWGSVSSWTNAESSCEQDDRDHLTWLASIHSKADNDQALTIVNNNNCYAWIGLRGSSRSNMTWSDGTPVDYTNWKTDDGSFACYTQDCCSLMDLSDGRWFYTNCHRRSDDNTVSSGICKAIPE